MEELRSKRHLFGDAIRKTRSDEKYTVITTLDKQGLGKLVVGLKAICGNVPNCPGTFIVYGEFTYWQISDALGGAYFRRKVIVGKETLDKFLSAPIPQV